VQILLIKQTSLGDVLHSTAQTRAIRERFPNCRLTILTSTTAQDIYRHNPHIDRIILFDRYQVKQSWWRQPGWVLRHIVETLREVRREPYDLALDLQGRWKSVIFLWGARASKRFVKGRWWFAQRFHHPQLHALEEMNGLLKLAGLGEGGQQTEFFTSASEKRSVKKKMSRHSLEGRRWILCCPISRWPTKDWPLNNYDQLVRCLPDDVMLVFAGSARDREAIRLGLLTLPGSRVVNFAGELSLAEFAELVNQAAAVLTGDSFPLHVAAANGCPTVALFGPTDEKRVGPIGDSTVIIRAESANCSRCYRRTYCPKACIRKIHPDQIHQALQRVTNGFF
jgi:heptosyltransferase-2/heptosyltransferase-3